MTGLELLSSRLSFRDEVAKTSFESHEKIRRTSRSRSSNLNTKLEPSWDRMKSKSKEN